MGNLTDTGYINRPNVSKKREMNDRQSPTMVGLNMSLFLLFTSLAMTLIYEDIKNKCQCSSKGLWFFFLCRIKQSAKRALKSTCTRL